MAAVDWSDDVQVADVPAPAPTVVDWSDTPNPQPEAGGVAPVPQRLERAAAFGYSDGPAQPTVVDWSDNATQVAEQPKDSGYTFSAYDDPKVFEQSQDSGEDTKKFTLSQGAVQNWNAADQSFVQNVALDNYDTQSGRNRPQNDALSGEQGDFITVYQDTPTGRQETVLDRNTGKVVPRATNPDDQWKVDAAAGLISNVQQAGQRIDERMGQNVRLADDLGKNLSTGNILGAAANAAEYGGRAVGDVAGPAWNAWMWSGDRLQQGAGAASALGDYSDAGGAKPLESGYRPDAFNFTAPGGPLGETGRRAGETLGKAYVEGGLSEVGKKVGKAWEMGTDVGYSDNEAKDIAYRMVLDPTNLVGMGVFSGAVKAGEEGLIVAGKVAPKAGSLVKALGIVDEVLDAPFNAIADRVGQGTVAGGMLGAMATGLIASTDNGIKDTVVANIERLPAEWRGPATIGAGAAPFIIGALVGRIPLGAVGRAMGGRGAGLVAANGDELVRTVGGDLRIAPNDAKVGQNGVRVAQPGEFYKTDTRLATMGGAGNEADAMRSAYGVKQLITSVTGDNPQLNSAVLADLIMAGKQSPEAQAKLLAGVRPVTQEAGTLGLDATVLGVRENRNGIGYITRALAEKTKGMTREARIDLFNRLQGENGEDAAQMWGSVLALAQNQIQRELGRGAPEVRSLTGRLASLGRELPYNPEANAAITNAFNKLGKEGKALQALITHPDATIARLNESLDVGQWQRTINNARKALTVAEKAVSGLKEGAKPNAFDPALRQLNEHWLLSGSAMSKQAMSAFLLTTPGYFVRNFAYTAPLTAIRTLIPNGDIRSLVPRLLESDINTRFGSNFYAGRDPYLREMLGGEVSSVRSVDGVFQELGRYLGEHVPPAVTRPAGAALSAPGRTVLGAAAGFGFTDGDLGDRTRNAAIVGGTLGAGPLLRKFVPVMRDDYWRTVNWGSMAKANYDRGFVLEQAAEYMKVPNVTEAQAMRAAQRDLVEKLTGVKNHWSAGGDIMLLPSEIRDKTVQFASTVRPDEFLRRVADNFDKQAARDGITLRILPDLSPRGLLAEGSPQYGGTKFTQGPVPTRPTPTLGIDQQSPLTFSSVGNPPLDNFRQPRPGVGSVSNTDPMANAAQIPVSGIGNRVANLVPDDVIQVAKQAGQSGYTRADRDALVTMLQDVRAAEGVAKGEYSAHAANVKAAAGEKLSAYDRAILEGRTVPGVDSEPMRMYQNSIAILQAESGLTKAGSTRKFFDLGAIEGIIRGGDPQRVAEAERFLRAYQSFLSDYDVLRLPKGKAKTTPVMTVPKGSVRTPADATGLQAYLDEATQAAAQRRGAQTVAANDVSQSRVTDIIRDRNMENPQAYQGPSAVRGSELRQPSARPVEPPIPIRPTEPTINPVSQGQGSSLPAETRSQTLIREAKERGELHFNKEQGVWYAGYSTGKTPQEALENWSKSGANPKMGTERRVRTDAERAAISSSDQARISEGRRMADIAGEAEALGIKLTKAEVNGLMRQNPKVIASVEGKIAAKQPPIVEPTPIRPTDTSPVPQGRGSSLPNDLIVDTTPVKNVTLDVDGKTWQLGLDKETAAEWDRILAEVPKARQNKALRELTGVLSDREAKASKRDVYVRGLDGERWERGGVGEWENPGYGVRSRYYGSAADPLNVGVDQLGNGAPRADILTTPPIKPGVTVIDGPSGMTPPKNAVMFQAAPVGALVGGQLDPDEERRKVWMGLGAAGIAGVGGYRLWRNLGRATPDIASILRGAGDDIVRAADTPVARQTIPGDVMVTIMARLTPLMDDLEQSTMKLSGLLSKASGGTVTVKSMGAEVMDNLVNAAPRLGDNTPLKTFFAYQEPTGGWVVANKETKAKIGVQLTELDARTRVEWLENTPRNGQLAGAKARQIQDDVRAMLVDEGTDPNAPLRLRNPNDPLLRPEVQAEVVKREMLAKQLRDSQAEILGEAAIPQDVARRIAAQMPDPSNPGWKTADGRTYFGSDVSWNGTAHVTPDGQTVTFTNSMARYFDPPTSQQFIEDHYRSQFNKVATWFKSTQGGVTDNLPSLRLGSRQLNEVQARVADKANREALQHSRHVMFGYDDRSVGQLALDSITPYSYFAMQALMQGTRYLAKHPGQYAVLLDGINRWEEETRHLPASMKWTIYAYTDSDGNEVRFNPMALLAGPAGSGLQLISSRAEVPGRAKDWIEEIGDRSGLGGLNFPLEAGRQAIGRATGLKGGLLPSDPTENRYQTSQGRVITHLSAMNGAPIEPEGWLMEAMTRNKRVGIDDYYAGLALQSMVRDGALTVDQAKAAILSNKQGKPDEIWNRAKVEGARIQELPQGGLARFVGAPVQVYGADRRKSDVTSQAYQKLYEDDAPGKVKSQFTKDNPSQVTRSDLNNDPRQLQLEIANAAYYTDKEKIDAKYKATLEDLSKQWESGKVTGTWWSQMRGNYYEARQKEYDALKAKHPNADTSGTKYDELQTTLKSEKQANAWQPDPLTAWSRTLTPGGYKDPFAERPVTPQQQLEAGQRALIDGYFAINADDPKYVKGESVDYAAYKKDRDAYLAKLTPAEREYVLSETKKNQTTGDKWYESQIAPRMDSYYGMPKYTGGTPEQQAKWEAADKAYNDASRKVYDANPTTNLKGDALAAVQTKAREAGEAAVKAAGLTLDDYKLGQGYENQERKKTYASDDMRPLREFYGNNGPITYTAPKPRYTDSPSPEEAVKRDNAQTLYYQDSATMNARSREARVVAQFGAATWNAVKATALKSDGTKTFGGTSGQGTSAASTSGNAFVRPGSTGSGNGSPSSTRSASNLGTNQSGRVNWDTAPVAKGIDGQTFTVRQFWQEQDLLRQRGQNNDAAKQLATNWQALTNAGVKLTGNPPTFRDDKQEAAFQERAKILDEYGKIKNVNSQQASAFYSKNADRLDALSAIISGKPQAPKSPFYPNTASAPRGSRGGSVRPGPRPAGTLPPRPGLPLRPAQPLTFENDIDTAAMKRYFAGQQGVPASVYIKRIRAKYTFGLAATLTDEQWIEQAKKLFTQQQAA